MYFDWRNNNTLACPLQKSTGGLQPILPPSPPLLPMPPMRKQCTLRLYSFNILCRKVCHISIETHNVHDVNNWLPTVHVASKLCYTCCIGSWMLATHCAALEVCIRTRKYVWLARLPIPNRNLLKKCARIRKISFSVDFLYSAPFKYPYVPP